ncbi:hypothetical protein GGU10DRAFT_130072 [Lentinula aff. detonsa]|uniref:Ser-Thr-rich glycosyl-phosphatidyl-inositol-anchored membrane family-domain-containing protein n=1 Tax=Lentinula aff. detonsa TaxID=2804958 RepID=A0AA38NTD6_9AGAR|nr:hypothetical protein GGU10DRAFT_130072 [Lentinula aff. detonsa]
MYFTTFNFFFVIAFALLALVHAHPVSLAIRDVFVPEVLTPKAGDTWVIGDTQSVTWNVSSPPAQITNPVGQLLLRKGELTQNVTLAGNFSILAGNVSFIVPSVTPDDDYSVVLFGDSGNFSPDFSIVANVSGTS